jgi:hypothetical protein
MKVINEIIDYFEGREERSPEDSPIFEVLEKMRKGAPDKYYNFYLLTKEFQIPKLQRANFQSGDDAIEEIVVKYKKPLMKKKTKTKTKEDDKV